MRYNSGMTIKQRAKLWMYPSETAQWYFISITEKSADGLRKSQVGKKRTGWGSIKVRVTVGKSTWDTSVFPEKGSKTYLLPVKASVRKIEDISVGDTVLVQLELF